ncbi:MAG: succinate dehydrogenase, hydrophobic membrane anchor protein [Acidobacteriota bacterium]|jgi:succinate dehydrogenase / fumarate reductase membrane anchor subunit|nr:succinate dehydrogenase, hydrophobic membrane anchor protein [Acidobacteriota bacterium]
MDKNFKQTSRSGSLGWLLQRISAVILFILLLFHFITYHFLTTGRSVSYQQVLERAQSWWFPLLQFAFLITALYHGLNGVWSVLEDYTSSKTWRLVWYSLLLTVGVVLLFVGTLTIIKLYTLKAV